MLFCHSCPLQSSIPLLTMTFLCLLGTSVVRRVAAGRGFTTALTIHRPAFLSQAHHHHHHGSYSTVSLLGQLRGGTHDSSSIGSSDDDSSSSSRIKPKKTLKKALRRSKRKRTLTTQTPQSSSSSSTTQSNFATNLHVSVAAEQGYRSYMEDEFVVAQDFCAVFDGHGGKAVSQYLKQNLFAHLQATLPSVLEEKEKELQQKQQHQQNEQEPTNQQDSQELVPDDETPPQSAIPSEEEEDKSTSAAVEPTVEDYCVALRLALDKVDREVQRINHWSYQGSTAVAAWLHHASNNNSSSDQDETTTTTTLIVANIGDSRAVYGRHGTAVPLTRDHKPDDPLELQRIQAAGGTVVWHGRVDPTTKQPIPDQGVYRVNGNLALSRAIGDRSERPAVTADPDITYLQLLNAKDDEATTTTTTATVSEPQSQPAQQDVATNSSTATSTSTGEDNKLSDKPKRKTEFIILATDGLWDVFSNQEVVDIVDLLLDKTRGELKHQRPRIADVIVREAIRRGTFDNVTLILIWLRTGDDDDDEEEETKQESTVV
ncbi:Protein phosphatase 2C [Seminavis robusta]|uniref:Protein phosphatase 2C n=1 Tax=Seminavis robusta TaxID=568900 RepID=A0A9N8DM79_9STRA|nr:Protein phosphatase 2C [Seminavis robusta]|eukprot:Sro161_g072590.1 Protein phosphatase 2C (543) ;mRNA; r:73911-75539